MGTNVNEPVCPHTWPLILSDLFSAQEKLMKKFKEIEQLPDPPLPLHAQKAQRIMKDFAWRVTEELCESFYAWSLSDDREVCRSNALEELSDATHFMIELMIFAGITASQFVSRFPMFPTQSTSISPGKHWAVVCRLGSAMNCLKNRPWKASIVPTDEEQVRVFLMLTFNALTQLWAEAGCSQSDVHFQYFRKHAIVNDRIQGGY